jgi:hypothetical protein
MPGVMVAYLIPSLVRGSTVKEYVIRQVLEATGEENEDQGRD